MVKKGFTMIETILGVIVILIIAITTTHFLVQERTEHTKTERLLDENSLLVRMKEKIRTDFYENKVIDVSNVDGLTMTLEDNSTIVYRYNGNEIIYETPAVTKHYPNISIQYDPNTQKVTLKSGDQYATFYLKK